MSEKRNQVRHNYDMLGKIPPQDITMEEAILGAIMLEKGAFMRVANIISDADFYSDAHSKIYHAIAALDAASKPIDILTVVDHLRKIGELERCGGVYAISKLTNNVASSANIEYHARIIKQKSIARSLIAECSKAISEAYDDTVDIFSLHEETIKSLEKLTSIDADDYSSKVRIGMAREEIYKNMQSEDGITGIPSGLATIDEAIHGWKKSELVVIGGSPGTFKTALAINFLNAADSKGVPSALFEQEMPKAQIGLREIAMTTGLDNQKLTTGRLSEYEVKQMEAHMDRLIKRNVYVDDLNRLTTAKLNSKIKKLKADFGVGLVVIDYLQLMNIEIKKYGSQETAYDYTVAEIKNIAKSQDVAIILLSGFNREAYKQAAWKNPPSIADLKGSGAIEAHSDIVMLTWNPARFDNDFVFPCMGDENFRWYGKLGLHIAKFRRGEPALKAINVFPSTNQFSDIKGSATYQPNDAF